MTDAIVDFAGTSNSPGNCRPILVQLKLGREFVNAIDAWRRSRPAVLPRTRAIVELASIGLADQALNAAKAAKPKHRSL
jgi:hypothetical protein